MNILNIYHSYTIPPNLQRHMFEVAAVGTYIAEHWTGPTISKNILVQALLLHDMGNIVKFKKPFLGDLAERQTYWETIQQQFIEKYGKDAHDATEAIIQELHVIKPVEEVIKQMRSTVTGSLEGLSWETKIADFADTCVTPKGIVGFEPRIADLKLRYNLSESDPKIKVWRQNAEEVKQHITVDVDETSVQDFSKEIKELEKTEIEVSSPSL